MSLSPDSIKTEQYTAGLKNKELWSEFERLRRISREREVPIYEERIAKLERLEQGIRARQHAIASAISADFGNRSPHESRIAEVLMLLDGIKHTRKHLKSWMRPEKRGVSFSYKPGRARIVRQPLGVVGIISPWNYPVQLALAPLASALAAGNVAMLKPSEYTPRSSELLAELCAETLGPELVSVVLGGADVGEAFSGLAFDHLVYTGSTAVGRKVMRAAAENLVPVTLELGGKSPTIVHESYPVEKAAQRIAWGKWANAGQTCVAPDYLLVPRAQLDAYVTAISDAAAKAYPTLENNHDYTSIINDRHYDRLRRLVDDAVAKGARKLELNAGGETLPRSARKFVPTILLDVHDDMTVMQEEIFGPVLPVVPYDKLEDAIKYVNERPRPLALYYFDRDTARVNQVLQKTTSGGASINETMLHFAIDDLPFGGVGPSGMGAYHGQHGFDTMSHKKAVFLQARWNLANMLAPPFGERAEKMLASLIGE